MSAQRPVPSSEGRRIVICDYNALLQSVTGLLRMSDYFVFQAHDGLAAQELCIELPDISLLVLNTYGTGIDVGDLIRRVRVAKPRLPGPAYRLGPPPGAAERCADACGTVYPGRSPGRRARLDARRRAFDSSAPSRGRVRTGGGQ